MDYLATVDRTRRAGLKAGSSGFGIPRKGFRTSKSRSPVTIMSARPLTVSSLLPATLRFGLVSGENVVSKSLPENPNRGKPALSGFHGCLEHGLDFMLVRANVLNVQVNQQPRSMRVWFPRGVELLRLPRLFGGSCLDHLSTAAAP